MLVRAISSSLCNGSLGRLSIGPERDAKGGPFSLRGNSERIWFVESGLRTREESVEFEALSLREVDTELAG
jgi:hypothetical protein